MTPAIVALLVILTVVWFAALFVFFRFFALWLRAFLAGARISLPTLVLMRFRRAPVKEIVQLKIMATQAGIGIPVSKIEAAALMGVDIERAVLALIRAKETGVDVTWEEVITQDLER